uniref:Uncharacterized protein n=1 Tax=Rousettus aegyptiacus TaxID=9407 RepID=A0A7J8JGZ2_ROUAE|nr:hypothetical protein HJG63_010392 [Rousettus aegyptiacus]
MGAWATVYWGWGAVSVTPQSRELALGGHVIGNVDRGLSSPGLPHVSLSLGCLVLPGSQSPEAREWLSKVWPRGRKFASVLRANLARLFASPLTLPSPPHFEFLFMTLSETISRHETWGGRLRSDLRNGAQLPKALPLQPGAVFGMALAATRLVIMRSSSSIGASPAKRGRRFPGPQMTCNVSQHA